MQQIPAPVHRRQLLRRRPLSVSVAWIVMVIALGVMVGCDNDGQTAARSAEQQAADLSRQLEAERQKHMRDLALVETQRAQAEEDTSAVNTILVSFGIAFVILILLLARERRARRILERLVRLLLDRLNGTPKPPRQST